MKCVVCPGETPGSRHEMCGECAKAQDALVAMLERGGAAALRVAERAIKATEHVRQKEQAATEAQPGDAQVEARRRQSQWSKKFWGRST